MIMLLSIYGFSDFVNEYNVRMDPARLAAQVISGIGFLGAGAIMRNGNIITGLTTAASLWVVAAIGLCVGAGFYKAAAICTALVITTLFILNKCEQFLTRKRRIKKIEIFASKQSMAIAQVLSIMEGQQLKVLNLSIVSDETQNSVADNKIHNMKICVTCKLPKHTSWLSVLEQLEQVESVRSINVVGKEYKIGDINSSFTSAG